MTNLQKLMTISIYRRYVMERYKEIFNFVKRKGAEFNIEFNQVVVTSSAEGNVTTEFGIDVRLLDYQARINTEMYKTMAEMANSSKNNNKLNVYLGYGLRTLEMSHMKASIVSGSHCAINDTIVLDVPSHKVLGLEAMKHRFAHEMLHEFGFEELQVLNMEHKYYEDTKNIMHDFVESLFVQIPKAEKDLNNRIDEMFMSDKNALCLLNDACDFLFRTCAPDLGNASITVLHPIQNRPISIDFL